MKRIPSNVTGKKRFNLPARDKTLFTVKGVRDLPFFDKYKRALTQDEYAAFLPNFVEAMNNTNDWMSADEPDIREEDDVSCLFNWEISQLGYNYWSRIYRLGNC